MTDYAKLSDRELDAKCAEFMVPGSKAWHCADTDEWQLRRCSPWRAIPSYSTDLNATRELEDEIERSDHCDTWYQYARALMHVCRADGDWHLLSYERVAWIAARTTARQRAEAFCAVMDAAQPTPEPTVVLEGMQPR